MFVIVPLDFHHTPKCDLLKAHISAKQCPSPPPRPVTNILTLPSQTSHMKSSKKAQHPRSSRGLGYQPQMILLHARWEVVKYATMLGKFARSYMILSRNYVNVGWLALRLMRAYVPRAFVSFLVLVTDNGTMIIDA